MKCSVLLSAILLFASCSNRSPLTKEEQKKVTAEVQQMIQSYCADVAKEGLLAEFKYLDSSAEFFWIPPGYSDSVRYDSIAAILKKNAPLFRSIRNTYDSLEILPISTTRAMYTSSVKSTSTDTTGKTTSSLLFENGFVIKRQDGWKLLCGKTTVKSK